MIVVLWGVSGCGKSTIGQLLAERLQCTFYDADDYHPAANVEKMRSGTPLTDADRAPWLAVLAELLEAKAAQGDSAVLACSALKARYRKQLCVHPDGVHFVHLEGNFSLIAARLAKRQHAFMSNSLLRSQFDTLEVDAAGVSIDIDRSREEICQQILSRLEAP